MLDIRRTNLALLLQFRTRPVRRGANQRTVNKKIVMHATSLPVSLALLLLILSILVPSSFPAAVTITFDLLEESPASTLIGVLSNETKIQRLFLYTPSVAPPPRRYSFLSHDLTGHQRLFHLTEVDGQLSAREPVDREGLCPQEPDATCEIPLDVAVVHAGSLLHTVKVVVRIVDLNDHSPRFVKDVVQLTISETAPVGTEFSLPEAEDPDSGLFGIRDFGLVGDDDDPPGTNGTFRLRTQRTVDGTTEVRLVLARNLDREEVERYRMRVLARDGGNPVRTGTLVVDVSVEDANDDPPRFVEPVSEVTIEENLANGTIIGVVKAVDRDLGSNGVVTYALTRATQHSVAGLFSVGAESGEIRVEGLVDFERRRGYTLGIVAVDGGSNPLSSHAVVTVHVTDVNDNPPRISVSPLTQSGMPEVVENAGAGTFAAHVSVTDPDTAGSGGEWNCTLTGNSADKFRLERIPEVTQNEFKLVTVVAFDREAAPSHHVTLTCADHGLPAMTSSADIDVRVLDENDEAPRFQLPVYSASVVENNRVGDFLVEVSSFDRDLAANGEISYAISSGDVSSETSGLLTIDAKLGRIYANVAFDRELKDGYEFRVIASDAGFPVRSAMVNFRLRVTDVNDESPRFSHRMYTFGTYENQPGGTEVGTVTAADADGPPNDVIQYEIVGGSSMDTFRIDPVSGRIASTKSLDREDVAMYLLNVTASNPGTSLRGQTQVKVIVADRNDNTPRILFPPTAAANSNSSIVQISSRARIGDVITAVEAVDDDVGSNAALRYVITGGSDVSTGLFGVNLLTGVLTVRRDLVNHADQSFPVRFIVHDEGQPRRSASASLVVTVNSSLEVMSSSSSSSSWGQRGPVPLSTLTMIAAAAGGSCIVVIAAVILFLVLRRRRRVPEVVISQPERGKMLPLAVDPPRGALIRNENHPDVKSNLLQYDVDSKPVRSGGRTTAVDSKNKKNTNKNSKNWNKNRKNVSRSDEDELQGKQIAWLATYEDNLLQTYKQKNNKMADPCTAATSPLPSNRTLPLPPPPPPPPPAPSSTTLYPSRYLERRCPQEDGGLRGQLRPGRPDQQASLSAAGAGCPVPGGFCARQTQQMKQSPDGCCLVVPPIDQSSDQGSVTDSGRGQSEDGEHATNSLRQVRHFPLPRDRQLATHAISSPGKPVGWTTKPTCVNCRCDQADHNGPIWNRALPEQHRLAPNRPLPNAEAPSELHRLGSRPLTGSDINRSISSGNTYIKSVPTGERTLTGSVHDTATGSSGHVTRNGRKVEEEDGYLSDDATTISGSYVLDHRDGGNVWREQQRHPCSPEASRV